jgi:hypothetical protein
VATCTTAAEVWTELNSMFSSQSRAHTIQLRTQLVATCKGDQFAVIYYNKMKGYVDEMAAAGKPLEDDVTPTFYKNNFFCANRSAYKNAYQIVVHMKNFSKINLV